MTRVGELSNLFQAFFSPEDLRTFLMDHEPTMGVALDMRWTERPSTVMHDVAMAMDQRRLLDRDFFEALRAARPKRAGEVERVAEMWLAKTDHLPGPPTPEQPQTHLRFSIDRDVRREPVALYEVMRDRLPDVCEKVSTIRSWEQLYSRARPPGRWCGYLVSYEFRRIAFLEPAVDILTSMVDELMTAGLHCIWDDKSMVTYWAWDSLYFGASETIRFTASDGGTRIHLECDYYVQNERISNAVLRGIADGLWRAVRPHQEALIRQLLEDMLAAADEVLTRG